MTIEEEDEKALSSKTSNDVSQGLAQEIDLFDCLNAIFVFTTFLPRCYFDPVSSTVTTEILQFSTMALMWPLDLLTIITEPWKPTLLQKLETYLTEPNNDTFLGASTYQKSGQAAAQLKQLQQSYNVLHFLESSNYIDQFLNLVLEKILRPISVRLKERDFEAPILGLIPLHIQYSDTSMTSMSRNEIMFSLLSNSAILSLTRSFEKIKLFHSSGKNGVIRYRDIGDMLKEHNAKKFDIRFVYIAGPCCFFREKNYKLRESYIIKCFSIHEFRFQ